MNKYLEIIIPVYNEQDNIADLVKRVDLAMRKAHIKYRIICIDDHSTDKTYQVIHDLTSTLSIDLYLKKGKPGKGYSILEGFKHSNSPYLAMIDGDGQYPPEAIVPMFEKLSDSGIVIAKRSNFQASRGRQFISKAFNMLFGSLLFGINYDIQSGLKLFRREVISLLNESDISAWTIDLPLIIAAIEAGYKVTEVEITFDKRAGGESKINLLKTAIEVGSRALKVKFRSQHIYQVKPQSLDSMKGAGVAYGKQTYITHTTLHPNRSAITTLHTWQKPAVFIFLPLLVISLLVNYLLTIQIIVAILSFIYFLDVLFNVYLIFKSLYSPPEIRFTNGQILRLNNSHLPVYSILCPLYKEAMVIPHFINSISKLDWPKDKLDVQLLLEEDDTETISAVSKMALPTYISVSIVPNSYPKTKPKACNYGLLNAKGKYLVIYDAEDMPDPLQLKKAFLAFQKSSEYIVCLQAKLNYYNPHQNILTRLFTAEYSLWFDIILTGLQSIETTIPLGGTSNHFRVEALNKLEGWDPFNVTEDCDLGIRLFQQGYRTAIIDSTTLEEANSDIKNWLRQRSRWIKGYMQTYLVHTRNPIELLRKHKIHALILQLTIGARISFLLINPILWAMSIAYFTLYHLVGPTIETFYPSAIFYMAATSLLFGNFLYLYNYMIGCIKREQWSLVKFVFLIPFYWLLSSLSATIAFYQLLAKPHYWEKTNHGLHLVKNKIQETELANNLENTATINYKVNKPFPKLLKQLKRNIAERQLIASGSFLILANIISNLCNFAFNAYLGRNLSIIDFGVLNLFTSIFALASIPMAALMATVSHKVAFICGKYSQSKALNYSNLIALRLVFLSLAITLFWVFAIPFIKIFFQADSAIPFIIFTPIWIIGILGANLSGYLKGTFSFSVVAFSTIIGSLSKLVTAFVIIHMGIPNMVYLSLPIASLVSLFISYSFFRLIRSDRTEKINEQFSWIFFTTSVLTGISSIQFLGLDVLLVKHFLTPFEAGEYGFLSLAGKIVFFFGSLFLVFTVPVVSRNEGAKKDSKKHFMFLLAITLFLTLIPILALGLFGNHLMPILFGSKASSSVSYLPFYLAATGLFTIATPIITFFQAKQRYSFVISGFLVVVLEVVLISIFHRNLSDIVNIMFSVSIVNLIFIASIYLLEQRFYAIASNLKILLSLVTEDINSKFKYSKEKSAKSILIFNWRDTTHTWAGGAEKYIQELAKRWVQNGYEVSIFCGNDGHQSRHEVIDGVRVIRRGGFYTVYVWAALYYIFRLRGNFDLIIDSENGIPFFTPLYIKKPKFLLIHHIHQEVFRSHLQFPFSYLAIFLESKLMPLIYKNHQIITVSQSSKKEILNMNFTDEENISVINPGVDLSIYRKLPKTKNPSLLYIGRLQPYKNTDLLLKVFEKTVKSHPKARLIIAGTGESLDDLKQIALNLNLTDCIDFLGKVSEEEKIKLLAQSWIMLQPSMIEGWGITVIEANASGTPVIASNVNGLKDSIVDGKTGRLVNFGDIEGFVKTIDYLIKNNDVRSDLSKEAYAWSKNFSWSKSFDTLYRIVEKQIIPSYSVQIDRLDRPGLSLEKYGDK